LKYSAAFLTRYSRRRFRTRTCSDRDDERGGRGWGFWKISESIIVMAAAPPPLGVFRFVSVPVVDIVVCGFGGGGESK